MKTGKPAQEQRIYKAEFDNGRENYIFASRPFEAIREAVRIGIQNGVKLVRVKPLLNAKSDISKRLLN